MGDETGIEELRILVNMAGWTNESAFDGLSALEVIKLLRVCRALDLEVLPDQLSSAERRGAIKTGRISTAALRRLYRIEGLAEEGPDWKGRHD